MNRNEIGCYFRAGFAINLTCLKIQDSLDLADGFGDICKGATLVIPSTYLNFGEIFDIIVISQLPENVALLKIYPN